MWPTPAVAISGKSLTRGSELSAPTDGCGLKGLLPSMVCAAMQQKKARSLLLAEIRRSHLTAEKKTTADSRSLLGRWSQVVWLRQH